jgi:hypothetical protein
MLPCIGCILLRNDVYEQKGILPVEIIYPIFQLGIKFVAPVKAFGILSPFTGIQQHITLRFISTSLFSLTMVLPPSPTSVNFKLFFSPLNLLYVGALDIGYLLGSGLHSETGQLTDYNISLGNL